MKHLRKFDSVTDMQTAIETAAVDFVGLAYDTQAGTAKLNIVTPPDPKATPFYIDVRGTVTLTKTSGLQMSTDGKTWTDTVAGDLPTGKTYFRVASDQTAPLKPNWSEKENSDYDIGGNINSLVKTSFKNETTSYSFSSYFSGKAKLISAGNLILPATELSDSCYKQMFYSCTSLTTPPALPATTISHACYQNMFGFCSSLTTAPALPATTLYNTCYSGMFQYCASLTTAPVLPAKILRDYCYQYMFMYCESLNKIIIYADNDNADYCLGSWVTGVAPTGDFYNLGTVTYSIYGDSKGIKDWTIHTSLD